MAFDESSYRRGRNKSFERLNRYRGLKESDNASLHRAMTAFYDRMREEGRQINRGETPVADEKVVKNLVTKLKAADAFAVRADWWLRHQNDHWRDHKWDDQRAGAAAKHVYNTGAWSKTTGMPAELRAILNDGRTLELTPGAAIIDGLETGFDRATPSPTLNYMWGEASQTFMGESRGTVQVDVLRGVDEYSVLNKIEMPELLKKMDAGEVDGVTFHVRRRNQQTGVLDESATFTVTSQKSWDQVPVLDRTESYTAEQGREYQTQQVSRAILRNRQGIQTSLDNFKQHINYARADSDTAVFMTAGNTPFPHEGAHVPAGEMAKWERHPSQSSTSGANWPAGTSAERTLYDKLAVVASRQGSTSSGYPLAQMPTASTEQTNTYLAPVNTVNSAERAYAYPATTQQLPTTAANYTSYTSYSTPGNPANMTFQEPDWGNELAKTMSPMSIAPDQRRESSASYGQYGQYGQPTPSTQQPYSYAPAAVTTSPYAASQYAQPTPSTQPFSYTPNPVTYSPYAATQSAQPTQPAYTMTATPQNAPANPAGGYPSNQPPLLRRSTTADSSFGEPLRRVDANQSQQPQQKKRGGAH